MELKRDEMNFLLTEGERVDLFQAYYSCKVVDITKISFWEYLCQAQLVKALRGIDGLKAKETCHHTFDNRGVEECILIKAADWRNLMELSRR